MADTGLEDRCRHAQFLAAGLGDFPFHLADQRRIPLQQRSFFSTQFLRNPLEIRTHLVEDTA